MRPLAAALDANLLVLWRGRPVEESFLTLYIRCGAKHPALRVRIRVALLRAPAAPGAAPPAAPRRI